MDCYMCPSSHGPWELWKVPPKPCTWGVLGACLATFAMTSEESHDTIGRDWKPYQAQDLAEKANGNMVKEILIMTPIEALKQRHAASIAFIVVHIVVAHVPA